MIDAAGNPSGFTVTICEDTGNSPGGVAPGNSLGTLTGSLNPITGGIFTYTPVSSIMLSRRKAYFIVLTAGTTVANGAYNWSLAGTSSYNPSGNWHASNLFAQSSNNGLKWSDNSGSLQFAITATPIPEPSALGLLGLSGFGFLLHRRKAKAV